MFLKVWFNRPPVPESLWKGGGGEGGCLIKPWALPPNWLSQNLRAPTKNLSFFFFLQTPSPFFNAHSILRTSYKCLYCPLKVVFLYSMLVVEYLIFRFPLYSIQYLIYAPLGTEKWMNKFLLCESYLHSGGEVDLWHHNKIIKWKLMTPSHFLRNKDYIHIHMSAVIHAYFI